MKLISDVYEFNGHYYQVVRTQTDYTVNTLTAGTQQAALDAATSMSYNGISGHLVTITSAEENAFLESILNTTNGYVNADGFQVVHPNPTLTMTSRGSYDGGDSAFYTAGSERASEGTFKWLAGPEEGQTLSYTNFFDGQPLHLRNDPDAILLGAGNTHVHIPPNNGTSPTTGWHHQTDGSNGTTGSWGFGIHDRNMTSGFQDVAGYIVEYSPGATTYSLSKSASSVNEGSGVTFTMATTNVAAGTSLSYSIGGVSSSDISGGQTSGTMVVGSNGQASTSVTLVGSNN